MHGIEGKAGTGIDNDIGHVVAMTSFMSCPPHDLCGAYDMSDVTHDIIHVTPSVWGHMIGGPHDMAFVTPRHRSCRAYYMTFVM